MPPRRSQRWLVRAGMTLGQPAAGVRRIEDQLRELGSLLSAALDPMPAAGRLALAGIDTGIRIGIAASTETPDRPAASAPDGLGRSTAGDVPDLEVSIDRGGSVERIVTRAQSGDAEAFGMLYDRYVDFVYRYTYYRVANRALAEDLTSETFTRALRRISTFSWQGHDFGAWLVTIARNIIADYYKSARFRLEVPTADLLGTGAERLAAGPEGQVLDSLTNAALLDAVRELGAEQQECVVLRFLEGLSVAETALAMGRTPGAVKALQYRAVRSLGKLLPPGFET